MLSTPALRLLIHPHHLLLTGNLLEQVVEALFPIPYHSHCKTCLVTGGGRPAWHFPRWGGGGGQVGQGDSVWPHHPSLPLPHRPGRPAAEMTKYLTFSPPVPPSCLTTSHQQPSTPTSHSLTPGGRRADSGLTPGGLWFYTSHSFHPSPHRFIHIPHCACLTMCATCVLPCDVIM